MTTIEYLSQIKEYDIRIDRKIAEKTRLREIAFSTGGISDVEKVKSSAKQDKLGETIAKILDAEKEIDRIIDIYVAKRQIIINQIEQIEDIEQYDVLHLSYVDGYSVKECAKIKDCSTRKIFDLRKKATNTFEKKFGKFYCI